MVRNTYGALLYIAGLLTLVSAPASAQWWGQDDWPKKSLKHQEQGRVAYKVDLSDTGKPVNCSITQSSGFARLDQVTCAKIMERARFKPATNSAGHPIASTYEGAARWELPADHQ